MIGKTETQIKVHDKYFRPFVSQEVLQERVSEMAAEISRDYADKNLLILGLLNGCFVFAADIFRKLSIPAEISFVKLRSYQGTTGEKVVEALGLQESLKGRHVLLLDDILDTGRTFEHFLPQLFAEQPASLKIAVLLNKPEARIADVHPDYSGMDIPNAFVLGYGLDYDGLGRNYPDLYVLADE
jgi:hypoxanthine phosphoribosyltransferase